MELVESGSIESRRHPKLPPTSTIKYPNNLQVYLVNERVKKTAGTADETELAEHEDATPECHENFVNEYHGKRNNAGSLASAGAAGGAESSVQSNASDKDSLCGSGGPPRPKVDEKTKVAVASLRKVHCQWDRARREFNGLVVQSANNEHTQGSKCELELAKFVEACNQADEKLVALEQIFLVGKEFSDEHIKEVAA